MPIDNDRFRMFLRKSPDKAWKYAHAYFKDRLIRIAAGKTNDRFAAQDIVQETFMDLWQYRHRIRITDDFMIEPYLNAIVKLKSITWYRNSVREKAELGKFEVTQTELVNEELEFVLVEEEELLWQCVRSLSKRLRECLTLKYKRNMTHVDIAKELSISLDAVEKNMHRAYNSMRKYRSLLR